MRKPSSDHTVIISEAAKSPFESWGLLERHKSPAASKCRHFLLSPWDSGDRQGQSSFLLCCISKVFFSVNLKEQKKEEARASHLCWGNHCLPTHPGTLSGYSSPGLGLGFSPISAREQIYEVWPHPLGWRVGCWTCKKSPSWLSGTWQFENDGFLDFETRRPGGTAGHLGILLPTPNHSLVPEYLL